MYGSYEIAVFIRGEQKARHRPTKTNTVVFARNESTNQSASDRILKTQAMQLRIQRANEIARNASTNEAGQFERARKF